MAERFHVLRAAGIAVTLDVALGHLRALEVTRDGRAVAPLHLAPWADDPAETGEPATAPNVMGLGGDFLCAPFGLNDVEPAPSHGWTANSHWTLLDERPHGAGGVVARFVLDKAVFGARVFKELTLRDGQPFVYQRHLFEGGHGAISVAHHVNTRLPEGGRLSFSPKAYADIPTTPQESDPARGRSLLAHPARTSDLSAVPLAAGGTVDLHRYPIADGHEDFAMLVEQAGSPFGWTAALRGSGDLLLVLKDPAVLPVTLLWFSNGGRYYPPWRSRHVRVLGIEDARCYSAYGHAASIAENELSRSGVPTAFTLAPDGQVEIRQVIGAVPVPAGWTSVASVEPGDGVLVVRDDSGAELTLGYDTAFLRRSGAAQTAAVMPPST